MQHTKDAPRIAFDSSGNTGPKVLLVMGFGMRGHVWKPQIEDLSKDHHVAWFDNRGIGESALPERPFHMRDLAQDVLRVADALDWQRFHTVGVSLGGMVSQELALMAPRRVQSLTLVATHAGGPLGLAPTATGLGHWVRAAFGPQAGRVQALTQLLYTRTFLDSIDPVQLRERMHAHVGIKPPVRTALMQLLAVMRHDTRRRLKHVSVPTLVVKPESDVLVRPFHSDVLHQGIPGAELLSVPDAGHGVTFQGAQAVNAAIRAHVSRCG